MIMVLVYFVFIKEGKYKILYSKFKENGKDTGFNSFLAIVYVVFSIVAFLLPFFIHGILLKK